MYQVWCTLTCVLLSVLLHVVASRSLNSFGASLPYFIHGVHYNVLKQGWLKASPWARWGSWSPQNNGASLKAGNHIITYAGVDSLWPMGWISVHPFFSPHEYLLPFLQGLLWRPWLQLPRVFAASQFCMELCVRGMLSRPLKRLAAKSGSSQSNGRIWSS